MGKMIKKGLISFVLLVAIGFCSVYLGRDALSRWLVTRQTVTVSRHAVASTQKKVDNVNNYDFAAVKPLSLSQLSRMSLKKGNLPVVGKVLIPSVGMNIPISRGVTARNLAFSAGTLKPNEKMGDANYALAGHHMANNDRILFGPLVRTHVGTKIYVTDMTYVYIYQVWMRKYIAANQLAILNDRKDQKLVTLVTCDDTGTGRLMAQGKFVQQVKVSELSAKLRHQITEK